MIAVMGAGAFGTALSISLCSGNAVTLWARDPAQARDMQSNRENARRLPGVSLPPDLEIKTTIDLAGAQAILLAVPTQKLRAFCAEISGKLPASVPLVACCKGIELGTGLRPSQIIRDAFPNAAVAVLTGPSFATDIARGLPTALTLACTQDHIARDLQTRLTTSNLRLYRTTDVTGAELGGAMKNVMAIACGAAIGAGLGDSARAALMTRGFAEMVRVAVALGSDPVTLNGLSGFGDLVLTCSSEASRNFRAGVALGQGKSLPEDTTTEGIATAQALCELADRHSLDLPITRVVTALAAQQLQVRDAMDMLLSRPLKEEKC